MTRPSTRLPKLPEGFADKGPDALLRLADLMDSDNEALALRAAQAVADRVYGKARERVEHSGSVASLSQEQIDAIYRAAGTSGGSAVVPALCTPSSDRQGA